MTINDEYEAETEKSVESDSELIQVGEDSKLSLDLNSLQMGKNLRTDDLIKCSVSQGGTYVYLSNVHFKDGLKTIDYLAQSLTTVITNLEGTWDKEIFVNYINQYFIRLCIIMDEIMSKFRKEKNKQTKWLENDKFIGFDNILTGFIKILKKLMWINRCQNP